MNGNKHGMELTGLVMPVLGHHLFSAVQANQTRLATTIHSRSNWEQASQIPADIWHSRMGHVTSYDAGDNDTNYRDYLLPCDVCSSEKFKPQTFSKTAAENTGDISVASDEGIARRLDKRWDLNRRGTENPTPTGQESPAAEDTAAPPLERDGGEPTQQRPDTNPTESLPTYCEPGGAAHRSTRARGAVAPVSHRGLNSHPLRERGHLGLFTSPTACDASARERQNDGVHACSYNRSPVGWSPRTWERSIH